MPRNDVIQYVREKDPSAANASDAEIASYIKDRYPDLAKELPQSGFSRIEQLRAQPKPTAFQREAAKHIRSNEMAQSEATYQQEIANAKGRAAGQAAELLPFAAAAPFTGGASLAGAVGLMGAAGVAGGLAREGTKAVVGSNEIPQTPAGLAKTLGLDAATGMAAEVGGRIATKVIAGAIPTLIVRSAVKHEVGARALANDFAQTRAALDAATKGAHIDVTNSFHSFLNAIDSLPKGVNTKTGKMLTSLDPEIKKLVGTVRQDITSAGGFPGSAQEALDVLIEMKGRINQIGWDKILKKQSGRQAVAVQNFAGALDNDIRNGLKAVSPTGEAEQLFNRANAVLKLQRQQNVGIIVAEEAIKRMAVRGFGGATIGGLSGGLYGYRHGGLGSALKGGAEGALGGAALGVMQSGIPRMSAWVYEMAMKHPAARDEMQRAIRFYIAGQDGKAAAAASRALMTADIRNSIKEAFRHPDIISPTTPPEQQTPPATAQR